VCARDGVGSWYGMGPLVLTQLHRQSGLSERVCGSISARGLCTISTVQSSIALTFQPVSLSTHPLAKKILTGVSVCVCVCKLLVQWCHVLH
jgi:hypothetical protein